MHASGHEKILLNVVATFTISVETVSTQVMHNQLCYQEWQMLKEEKISGNLKTDNNNLRKYLRFFIRLFYKASKIVYLRLSRLFIV